VLLVEGGDGGVPLAKISDFGISRFRELDERTLLDVGGGAAGSGGLREVSPQNLTEAGALLGGDERRFPARLFAEPFAYARAQGLHGVAHAGEADGAASVRDALELLGAERIGHGIRALEDPQVVELLAERRAALEICPTSNRLTGVALEGHPHPYEDFDRHGCLVTIDVDDPSLFGTSITEEYRIVERAAGAAALERYVRNAVEASFASPVEKAAMLGEIERAVAELREQSRS